MKTKAPTTIDKKGLDKKTPAIQRADMLDFIGETIRDSRSVVSDIIRDKHAPESVPIPQRAKKDSASIYYSGI